MKYLVALDQGTTSSRAIIFNDKAEQICTRSVEFEQLYPKPGWVEHRPQDILDSQLRAMRAVVEESGIDVRQIAAVGIANQRETTLLWERSTGKPISNAIVWQCRRTAPLVERLKNDGLGNIIRDRTGLIPDAYFSGTKLQWMLDTIPGAKARAKNGELCFGTVDSFLVWHLTGGKVHVTDATNASRTMLYNIHEGKWDETLLRAMDIPEQVLPQVVNTSGVVGMMDKGFLGCEIPIAAMAGDQHAALFGQGCFAPGMCKNTYGTGCFLLMNTGFSPIKSQHDLLTTIAWQLDGKARYALEGSVFVGGAVVQWLRDEMKLIRTSAESEQVAQSIPDNGSVYMVPAFTGLGAPYWDMYSRGTIVGLTRGTGRAHIVRAALESIAYQSADVINAMTGDLGMRSSVLRVDGGASSNNFLMQFQADILDMQTLRPRIIETTALGAAMLAGRAVGIWNDGELQTLIRPDREFVANMDESQRIKLMRKWHHAIDHSRGWALDDR